MYNNFLAKEKEYKKTIKELEGRIEAGEKRLELAVKDLIEKLELEKEAKEKMSVAHQKNIQTFIDEKELAYMKAQSTHGQYLDTLEKLKKTDYQLENAHKRIEELESELEQRNSLVNPLKELVKILI